MTVAADPESLRRYTGSTTQGRAGAHAARLGDRLDRLRLSRSDGLHQVGALDASLARWFDVIADVDGRPAQVGAALQAADRGTWAGTVTSDRRRALALVATHLRVLATLGSASAVRRFARDLTPDQQRDLAWAHPELVGPLEGLPVTMRYQANAVLVERHADEYARIVPLLERAGLPSSIIDQVRDRRDTFQRLREPTHDLASCSWLPRQLLLVSDAGDGRAIEVFGDLDAAVHVSVFVPGITNTLDNFLDGTATNANRIHAEASALASGGVATIAWLGYDTPGWVDAPLAGRARSSAPTLRRFFDTLDLRHGATTTLIGHSYGSLVSGQAVVRGLDVDNVVFAGSPGTGVSRADAFPDHVQVFALRAPFDPVAMSEWHGADPADPRFGATPLRTGDHAGGGAVRGHSAYFDQGTESLHNIGLVVTGRADEVTTVPTDWLDGGLRWVDDHLGWVPTIGPAVETTDWVRDLADDLDSLGLPFL